MMRAEPPHNVQFFLTLKCTDTHIYKNLKQSSYPVIGTVSPPTNMPVISTACWDRIFPEITHDSVIANSCRNPYFHHLTPTLTNQTLHNKMIAGTRRSRFAWDDGKGLLWIPVLVTTMFGLALGGAPGTSRTQLFLKHEFPMRSCLCAVDAMRCTNRTATIHFPIYFLFLFFIRMACIIILKFCLVFWDLAFL